MARKMEREALSKGKKVGQSVKLFHPTAQRWLTLIALSLIISVLLFPNILSTPKVYKTGDVAERDIKASHDFLIENEELTEKNRQDAVKKVPYVYDFDTSGSNLVFRIREAFSEVRDYSSQHTDAEDTEKGVPLVVAKTPLDSSEDIDLMKDRFFKILEIPPDETVFKRLAENGFPAEVEEEIIRLTTQVFKKGVVGNREVLLSQVEKGIILHNIRTRMEVPTSDLNRFYDIEGAKKVIEGQRRDLRKKTKPPKLADLSIKLAVSLIKPNLTFNKRETEERKDTARKSVKPFYFKIKKNEMLVREGERIGPEHVVKLSEGAKSLRQTEMLGRVPGMVILIMSLFAVIYLVGLMESKSFSGDGKDLIFYAVILLTIFTFIWTYVFIAEEVARGFHFFTPKALLYAMPVACGAMLIAIFQGIGMAVTFSLVISVLASLLIDKQIEFFIYFFINSLVAAYGVIDCRERGILIKTGFRIGMINIILSLSMETINGSLYSMEAIIAAGAGFIGGILVGIISTGIIPIIEMAFGFTTDIKLLELANLDQPLLRNLMVQTPGTYHHSVIVSNMVEATAKAIQSNPLLAKVSAYYHDIGKMKKPLYFIENQIGEENRHEKLAPSMSSLVLISHVKDGVELAKKDKLGREIIDIIEQHHGTNLISFFYQKAKEQTTNKGGKSTQAKEEDFRYPGPKPQTKEAGLVMLADMVEAASRSLVDPNPARIQGTVQKIINRVFSDGQLDECELTLKDLNEIAKSFNKTLSGIFHQRVEYPEMNSKTVKKAGNGDTNQVSAEDSEIKRPEDKTANEEGLKRLGQS